MFCTLEFIQIKKIIIENPPYLCQYSTSTITVLALSQLHEPHLWEHAWCSALKGCSTHILTHKGRNCFWFRCAHTHMCVYIYIYMFTCQGNLQNYRVYWIHKLVMFHNLFRTCHLYYSSTCFLWSLHTITLNQNTNTIDSTRPNLPPNTVAIFHTCITHERASLHCIQTLVSKPGFAALCTHSWEGTSLPQNSVCSEMCFSVELYDLAVVTGIVLQWSCHLLCIFHVQNAWQDDLHL
jgi:hypothetical protein